MFTINYSAFQSATACRSKNGVREFCNTIRLDAEGFIVATDGHILFCGKADAKSEESITVDVMGKAPSKFDYVEIDSTVAKFYSDRAGFLIALPVRLVDCPYPDWRRITRFAEGQIAAISCSGKYLITVAKVGNFYNKKAIQFEFQGYDSAMRVFLSDTDFIALMPVVYR